MTTAQFLCLAIFGLAAGFFSFTAYSLRDFSRSELDEACRRIRRPERFGQVLKRSDDVLIAAEFWATLFSLALVVSIVVRGGSRLAAIDQLTDWVSVATEAAIAASMLLILLILLPWSLARVVGEDFLARSWPFLTLVTRLVGPYVHLARVLDRLMHRLWGLSEPEADPENAIVDEIRTVVDQGHREGILETQARRMIDRVIQLEEEDVAAVMTPRTDMDCIPVAAGLEEARRMMLESGHSRMPVIGESIDDVVGIVYAKDLLKYLSTESEPPGSLREIVREPFYVPETTSLDRLLESMKRRGVHIAIVVDEYSGVAGLVTMEDVLEEIVGDIVDEYDPVEESGIRTVSAGVVDVEAWVHVDDLNEQFSFDFPEDGDYDTIGGFIYAQLERIPKRHEVLTWKNVRVTVLEVDKRRIHRIRIENLHAAETQTIPVG